MAKTTPAGDGASTSPQRRARVLPQTASARSHALARRAAVLDGMTKRYSPRGRPVLGGIDLTVEAGTTALVTGANGSGKSTLLRILAGASVPTTGFSELPLPGRTAFVPEQVPSALRMTVAGYLSHMGRLRRMPDGVTRRRAGELLERLGLSPGPDAPIASLSKGNAQKVTLAQALLAPVELLVLDEPFGSLDEEANLELVGLLAEACGAGTAVVVSSHGLQPDLAPVRVCRLAGGLLA